MYDLIGDTHGHADALQRLLKKLGYCRRNGLYRHPERQAIFLEDSRGHSSEMERHCGVPTIGETKAAACS